MLLQLLAQVLPKDPLGQVERAQVMIEKGPQTFVAGFFAIGFFLAIVALLRSKDRHLLAIEKLNKEHDTAVATKDKLHAEEMSKMHLENRSIAIKLELAVHGLLEMMEDFRIIAFEARRTRQVRSRKAGKSDVDPAAQTAHHRTLPPEGGGS